MIRPARHNHTLNERLISLTSQEQCIIGINFQQLVALHMSHLSSLQSLTIILSHS